MEVGTEWFLKGAAIEIDAGAIAASAVAPTALEPESTPIAASLRRSRDRAALRARRPDRV